MNLNVATWTREQWMLIATILALVIVVLLVLWPRESRPSSIEIDVIDQAPGKTATIYSTQIVPLH